MNAAPDTMRAIDPAAPGGPEVLEVMERPVPRPGPGEVLIRVAAAGVNRPDVVQRMGMYPPPPGAPSIPGLVFRGSRASRILTARSGAPRQRCRRAKSTRLFSCV